MRIIRGKKAMVTGAASGIGRAIALALAKEGADLFLIDIDQEHLAAVAREAQGHGVEVITVRCDLAEPAQIGAAVERLRATWGRLNILVNNAGIAYYGHTHAMTGAQWQRLMAVNLLAPIQLVHELLPVLFAAEDAHILNVCSFFGLTTWRKMTAYQTSKFGLVGFSAALRAEYGRASFGVTALCPGFVHTAMLEQFETAPSAERRQVPSWICTTPEKVAARAVRAIRSNRGIVVITPAAHLYWWLTRLCPALVGWVLREGWRRKGPIA
jgi:short-subunit dehydrogenase